MFGRSVDEEPIYLSEVGETLEIIEREESTPEIVSGNDEFILDFTGARGEDCSDSDDDSSQDYDSGSDSDSSFDSSSEFLSQIETYDQDLGLVHSRQLTLQSPGTETTLTFKGKNGERRYREINSEELSLETDSIGRGNFGIVYRGTWRGAKVAVKKLDIAVTEHELDEFRREAELMTLLGNHPNVVNL
eukprot:TRINITY_DN11630_c0_g2_i1.p1 TRINITY_DN11630_c0_g2~~TRINITY_DN11630_c0_g2_i1.p1  ORF type:complete len:189 (-),score=38.30 TRINITY_DN11630_c0_g2_i1:386-952(-)